MVIFHTYVGLPEGNLDPATAGIWGRKSNFRTFSEKDPTPVACGLWDLHGNTTQNSYITTFLLGCSKEYRCYSWPEKRCIHFTIWCWDFIHLHDPWYPALHMTQLWYTVLPLFIGSLIDGAIFLSKPLTYQRICLGKTLVRDDPFCRGHSVDQPVNGRDVVFASVRDRFKAASYSSLSITWDETPSWSIGNAILSDSPSEKEVVWLHHCFCCRTTLVCTMVLKKFRKEIPWSFIHCFPCQFVCILCF